MESKLIQNAKRIIISFFILIFIMGFFSKSIINLFLPKVSVEVSAEGVVERTLSLEGSIHAQKTFKLRLPGDVIIDEYFVKSGDVVQEGKPLFKIDMVFGLRDSIADIEKLKLQVEAQKLNIEKLQNTSYEIDMLNISAMDSKLLRSKEDLIKQQELFDAGIIALQELEGCKEKLQQQELALEIAKLQLEQKKREDTAMLKSAENGARALLQEIDEIQKKQNLYSRVERDGICYSPVSGIVSNVNDNQSTIARDSVIVEIAEASEEQAFVYAADISEADVDFIKSAGSLQINGKNALDSKFIDISSIFKISNQNTYRVEGIIKAKEQEGLGIGQRLKCTVRQRYSMTGYNKLPKSAIIVFGDYEADSSGIVYLLEEKEGVLGIEYIAKEAPVKLMAVGDDEVIVSGLETIQKPRVIVNLSYKIRDGVKVFLWQ